MIGPVIGFGPVGYPEMVVIFLIILLLFGAKKLPQLARGLGKSMGEFKKAKDEFEHEITRAEDEVTQTVSSKESQARERDNIDDVIKEQNKLEQELKQQAEKKG